MDDVKLLQLLISVLDPLLINVILNLLLPVISYSILEVDGDNVQRLFV
ncbi:unnamed protein product [Schistosoma curassoni]|uniref:MATE family efflux transporter n=1 Tax=Schistosoma curassoni TaxID=6186 RepID=A0A183KJT0_9TREM|nr:unnamed protein product [Schistosoma curassoni]